METAENDICSVPKTTVLYGHARLNGHRGKIAHFCPFLCNFVILNGVRYAPIEEINDKTRDKNASTIEGPKKKIQVPIFLSKIVSFAWFRSFFAFRNARFVGKSFLFP